MHRSKGTHSRRAVVGSIMPALGFASFPPAECHVHSSRQLLGIRMPSFATSLRHTSAPKGLRTSAQGQPSLSEATLGMAVINREANPSLRHTTRSPAASSKSAATLRAPRQLQKLTINALKRVQFVHHMTGTRLKRCHARAAAFSSAPKVRPIAAQGKPSLSEPPWVASGISESKPSNSPHPPGH